MKTKKQKIILVISYISFLILTVFMGSWAISYLIQVSIEKEENSCFISYEIMYDKYCYWRNEYEMEKWGQEYFSEDCINWRIGKQIKKSIKNGEITY